MEKKVFEVVKPNVFGYGNSVYFSSTNRSLFHAINEVYGVLKKDIGRLRNKNYFGKRMTDLKSTFQDLEYLAHTKEQLKPILLAGFSKFDLGYVIDAGTAFADDNYTEWKELLKIKRKTQRQKRRIITLEKKIPENCAYLRVLPGKSSIEERITPYISRVRFVNIRAENDELINKTKDELLRRLGDVDGPRLSFDTPVIFEQHDNLGEEINSLISKYGKILFDSEWKKQLLV